MATLETLEWTGKILAVAGPVLTFMWWVFRTFHRYHRLQAEHADLKKTLTAERGAHAKDIDVLRRERDALPVVVRAGEVVAVPGVVEAEGVRAWKVEE